MQNMRQIRQSRGMTAREVAAKIGVQKCVIDDYEKGKHVPSVMRAAKIADVLDCSVDDLIGCGTPAVA